MSYIAVGGMHQGIAGGLPGKARVVPVRNGSEYTRTPSVKVR